MNALSELYLIAEEESIRVVNFRIANSKTKGICINFDNDHYDILIDYNKVPTYSEEKCVLAHELGHYCTGVESPIIAQTFRDMLTIGRQEYRANKWAFERLIPVAELHIAINRGYVDIWELADYFDVPDEFMRKALDYYENKRGGVL